MFVGDPSCRKTGNINVLAIRILEDSYIPTYFFIPIRNVIYLMVLHGLSSIAQLLAIVPSHCSHIQQLQCLYGNLFF